MKMMKKAAAMILSVCLTVPMFGTIVSAAQGQLMFSDPETKVGETVDVSLVVKTGGDAIGDADITMRDTPEFHRYFNAIWKELDVHA